MDHKTNILIIGGGPSGTVCALTAKKYYPGKEILIIKNVANSVIPCGIPYMFSSLDKPEKNKFDDSALRNAGIEMLVGEAKEIDRKNKKVITTDGGSCRYEKLVIATGSKPIIPDIKGINKKGIYPIHKNLEYLKSLVDEIKECKNVAIIGGGFIGVEFADEISKFNDKKVYLIELLPRLLTNSFDEEFCTLAEEKLKSQNVEILTNKGVVEILGSSKVDGIKFSDGSEIDADAVILGIGSIPDTELALKSGLSLGKGRGVWVDEYMRTADQDVFAIGDCAGKREFFTRKDSPTMLASIATSEARIAGANLYSLKVVRENKGVVAAYSTCVSDLVLASAGLTEKTAREEGFEIIIGKAKAIDKHPGALPYAHQVMVKLIFSKDSEVLMGGQIAGSFSCAELINIIVMGIESRILRNEMETFQFATHPYLTPSPVTYHLINAAMNAKKQNGHH